MIDPDVEFDYDPDTLAYAIALVKQMNATPEDRRYAGRDMLWAVTRGLVAYDPRVLVMGLLICLHKLDEVTEGGVVSALDAITQEDLAAERKALT